MVFSRRASKTDQTLISRRTQRRNLHTLIALVASSSAPRSSSNTTVIFRRTNHRPFPPSTAAGAATGSLRGKASWPSPACSLPLSVSGHSGRIQYNFMGKGPSACTVLFCGIRLEIAGFRTEGETYGLCQQILRIGEGLMRRTIREMSRCI